MKRPNIVWLTVDSLRYDHTSLATEPAAPGLTPNLARLADGGVSFQNAFSHAIWTQPSSASILSGTYPSVHGVGLRDYNERLPSELATVPELLGAAGYRTACVSEMGNVGPATGLDRGFDRYHPPHVSRSNTVLLREHHREFLAHAVRHVLPNLRHVEEWLDRGVERLKDGAMPLLTNAIVERRIDEFESGDDPFLVYAHYNSPHVPNAPPRNYIDADAFEMSVADAIAFSADLYTGVSSKRRAIARGLPFSDDEWSAIRELYRADVRFIDATLATLADRVRALDDTVLVVTSDHGELFGEAGGITHRLVTHDAVSHVPLVVAGLDGVASADDGPSLGAVVDRRKGLVQHMDLMESLVAAGGGDTGQFQGVDLRHEDREYAVVQKGPSPRTADSFAPYLEHDASFDTSRYHETLTTALRSHDHKYVRSEDRAELYTLPDEETDRSADLPDVAAEFAAAYEEWWATYGETIPESGRAEFDEALEQQLVDLGYRDA